MKIDAHHHFWNPEVRDYYWMEGDALAPIRRPIGVEDMRPLLADHGIDGTVIVQTIPSLEETEHFLEIAGNTDFVKGVVGWIDLTADDVAATIARLQASEHGKYLVGIRHQAHDEEDKNWLVRPDVLAGIKACGDAGLVYDLLLKEPEMAAAIRCADTLPDVQFVVDHIAKPRIAEGEMEPWKGHITALAERPNVWCKLSGMVTEADWSSWSAGDLAVYADVVMELFGADRVMFGSDWPVCLLAAEYHEVVDAAAHLTSGLSEAEKTKLFGGNAVRFYKLDSTNDA